MDIDQLKYFQVLADAGNFTRASSELILSQSALSRSISRLENELGVPLFERKSHGVVLNRYGKIVLAHAQRAVGEIKEARQQIHDLVNPAQKCAGIFLWAVEVHQKFSMDNSNLKKLFFGSELLSGI